MRRLITIGLVAAALPLSQEPTPRRLSGTPIRLTGEFATISGARELRDGRILVSDATRAAVVIVDPRSGASTQIGSPGGNPDQYAQPGGFYSGLADTVYLLDRGQAKFLVIAPSGAIVGSRSIRVQGRSGSSSDDVDHQRVDARGLAYFIDIGRLRDMIEGRAVDSARLTRFDALRQHGDTVAALRQRDKKVTNVDEHMQLSRAVFGSPQDDWGVAPDGRIAIVRASPYRVEWVSSGGQVTRGPIIATEAIAYTQAEKDAITAATAKSGVGGGVVGGAAVSPTNMPAMFAPTKPPFEPNDVVVSPERRVWVLRTQRAGATTTLYDVFDGRGERVDRVELAGGSRVIGFGPGAVYVVERERAGSPNLKKYKY